MPLLIHYALDPACVLLLLIFYSRRWDLGDWMSQSVKVDHGLHVYVACMEHLLAHILSHIRLRLAIGYVLRVQLFPIN